MEKLIYFIDPVHQGNLVFANVNNDLQLMNKIRMLLQTYKNILIQKYVLGMINTCVKVGVF